MEVIIPDEKNKVAEIGLVYHSHVPASERPKISSSRDAERILRQSWDINRIELVEQFKMLLLDKGSRCLGISEISTGGTQSTIADPKVILVTALMTCASSIILSHNHPSGNLNPSLTDIELTKKLINGAKLLDMNIVDHLIITREGYKSFSDLGLI